MSTQKNGFVKLQRIHDSFGTGRDLRVFIDGSYSASIPYSSERVFELEPGSHHIFVKMDWCKSKPLKIEIRSDETLDLFCGSRFADKTILVTMLAAFFVPRTLFYVGTESIITTAQGIKNKKHFAKILAYAFTPILMIPVLVLLKAIALLTFVFSDIFGAYSAFANITIFFILFFVAVFAAI
ncbi:MAG: hypothetical protein R6W75_08490, partial [Smithellaceae bacterium]